MSVLLNLGDADNKSDIEIINLLNVLFSTSLTPDEKKERLSRDFHIAITRELESEVQNMCNLSQGIWEQGQQQGEDMLAQLMTSLFQNGRMEDAKRVAEDKTYRKQLMKEFEAKETP
jgi:hypothetical protein